MRTDTVLRCDGMKTLVQNLGVVEAERFITLILREPFNCREWRKNLFGEMPLDQFLDDAMRYRMTMSKIENG